jgi:hypothetical protein
VGVVTPGALPGSGGAVLVLVFQNVFLVVTLEAEFHFASRPQQPRDAGAVRIVAVDAIFLGRVVEILRCLDVLDHIIVTVRAQRRRLIHREFVLVSLWLVTILAVFLEIRPVELAVVGQLGVTFGCDARAFWIDRLRRLSCLVRRDGTEAEE